MKIFYDLYLVISVSPKSRYSSTRLEQTAKARRYKKKKKLPTLKTWKGQDILKRKESDVLRIPKSLVIWASHPTILSLMSIGREIYIGEKRSNGYKSEKEEFGEYQNLWASHPSICLF